MLDQPVCRSLSLYLHRHRKTNIFWWYLMIIHDDECLCSCSWKATSDCTPQPRASSVSHVEQRAEFQWRDFRMATAHALKLELAKRTAQLCLKKPSCPNLVQSILVLFGSEECSNVSRIRHDSVNQNMHLNQSYHLISLDHFYIWSTMQQTNQSR